MSTSAELPSPKESEPALHAGFLSLQPAIERHARLAFRHLPAAECEEKVAESVAAAFQSYVRLRARGKDPATFPSRLSQYAVLHTKSGRHVGSRWRRRDVLSEAAQQRHGFRVESLDSLGQKSGPDWQEALVHDTQTPVPDQASFRIDFPRWLANLAGRDRSLAQLLMAGHSSKALARRAGVTPSRICQLRQQLREAWHAFHGEPLAQR